LALALDYSRRSTEVLEATAPAGHRMVVAQHADHAGLLVKAEQFEAALTEFQGVLAQAEHNQALQRIRPGIVADVARTTFELGRHAEAIRTGEHALDELTSQKGRSHPETVDARRWLAGALLELGKLDEASRHVEALEELYRADPEAKRSFVTLEGTLAAQL